MSSAIGDCDDSRDQLLLELKQFVSEHASSSGVTCPVCEKWVAVSKRFMNRHHMAVLLRVFNSVGRNWCRLHAEFAQPMRLTSYTIPKYWNLIETHDSDDPASPDSAEYRITAEGEAFLNGSKSVWEHVFVLNDEVVSASGEMVFASDVWQRESKFDIREVMDLSEFNRFESQINRVLRIPPFDLSSGLGGMSPVPT